MRGRHFAESVRELGQAAPILAQGGDWTWSFRNEWRHFVNAIQQGAPVGGSVEDGVRAAEIVSAVLRSADCGAPVHVGTDGLSARGEGKV